MSTKSTIFLSLVGLAVTSCNNQPKGEQKPIEEASEITSDYSLIGKKGLISFPEMNAEVTYNSDSTLHWKTIDIKGNISEGDEKMDYKQLTENLHFLNWIEKEGFTVSQIIDTKNGSVKAFWSFADESSPRGKRNSMFVDGKFKFEN